jgi:hypothetical protein
MQVRRENPVDTITALLGLGLFVFLTFVFVAANG